MPLSEGEERILHEIEQRFYAHDPESARRIESTTLTRYLARNCRWSALGFIAGLIVLMVSFASSWVLGVFGFLLMLGSAIVFVQNLRRMGEHGIRQLREAVKAGNAAGWGDVTRRFRRGGDEGQP